jgi:hypothetical protein
MGEAERAERGVTVGGKRPAWSGLVWSGTQPTTYPPRGGDEGAGGRTPFFASRVVSVGGWRWGVFPNKGVISVVFFLFLFLGGVALAGLDFYSCLAPSELVRMYHYYYCCML